MTTDAGTVPAADDGARRGRRRALLALALALVVAAAATVALLRRGPTAAAEPAVVAVDAGSGDVSAFPAPGTAVVRPEAELSFRGPGLTDAAALGDVRVVGSESGEHTTRAVEHSDGAGVSLLPDEPFAEGEEVTVTTSLAVRGADDGTYTLGVARLAERPEAEVPPVQTVAEASALRTEAPAGGGEASAGADPSAAEGSGTPTPTPTAPPVLAVEHVRTYVSAPGVEPPVVEVTGPEAGTTGPDDATSPGLTALGVKNGYGQKGPLLVDDAGEPVWFRPLEGVDARDVQVQQLAGEPVLTWWEGRMARGYGWGEAVVVDEAYEEVARIRMAGGYDMDSHEVRLTEAGTALVIAYEPVRMDLSAVGGDADGAVVDNVVQEIDLATGALLHEWHSVGTIALDESYLAADEADGEPFDYAHVNSVAVDDDGDLIVSARHTCAVYSVDRDTGTVEWRLGGRRSDVTLGEGATFLKQHDARRSADGTLTLLDNGGTCGETTREETRGLALDVDLDAGTAEVVREHHHPDGLFAESQSNYQELADGRVVVGWGSLPRFSLLGPDGEVLLDGTFPEELHVTSYRAHRVDWTGSPATDPSAVVVEDDGARSVHASWNGATEVASWRVVTADGAPVATAARTGFETTVPLPPEAPASGLRVEAVDGAGAVLGTAEVADA